MMSSEVGTVPAVKQTARVSHGGETRMVEYTSWNEIQAVCDELIAAHGPGVPSIERLAAPERVLITPPPADDVIAGPSVAVVPEAPASNPLDVKGGEMDILGQGRSLIDYDAAVAAGFAPRQTVFERGTRVIGAGVQAAKRERRAYDEKPLVREYCADFATRIEAEQRTDLSVLARELRMAPDGSFVLDDGFRFSPTYGALNGLATRLGYGGAQYLAKCDPGLRGHNVNAWRDRIAATEDQAYFAKCLAAQEKGRELPAVGNDVQHLKLRVRKNEALDAGMLEAFGVVTPTYTPFDVDRVAKVIASVAHPESRGTVTYDGARARFEILFHSNVQPRIYVAGEFFKAGIIVRTDDIGSGSIWGQSVIWQNLCLNLAIIDRNAQELFRLKHIGSADELERALRAGIAKGQDLLAHFIEVWGYACEEDVLKRTAQAAAFLDGHEVPMKVSEALPGIFNGLIERDLVKLPGRRADAVPKLVAAWEADTSGAKLMHDGLTRASIVNALTRYAHTEVPASDPWAEDEIQRAASALLWGKGSREPAPLPYVPFEV